MSESADPSLNEYDPSLNGPRSSLGNGNLRQRQLAQHLGQYPRPGSGVGRPGRAYSASLWLMPARQGTKIIAEGAIAVHLAGIVSWPADGSTSCRRSGDPADRRSTRSRIAAGNSSDGALTSSTTC